MSPVLAAPSGLRANDPVRWSQSRIVGRGQRSELRSADDGAVGSGVWLGSLCVFHSLVQRFRRNVGAVRPHDCSAVDEELLKILMIGTP